MKAWLVRHLQVFFYSLGQLWRSPWGTLMSVAVIAISLVLPSALYLALEVVDDLSGEWHSGAEISLFLKSDVSDDSANRLANQIAERPQVASVHYVSATAALEEFREKSGFGAALDLLDENPLPGLLRVLPHDDQLAITQAESLLEDLSALPEVDQAEFDYAWVQRLHAMVQIGQRLGLIFSILLGGGVVLIIGNTIRLAIFSRRQEIEINKLIGATNGFIRRPFLYSGMQQGALGGLLALLMIYAALSLLAPAVGRLAGSYQSDFALQIVGWVELLLLPLLGGALGWAGAWLAVGRHLREIEPG